MKMATPPLPPTLHRKGASKRKGDSPPTELERLTSTNSITPPVKKSSDWDFKLALVVLTIAAFVTRFWGISHPNQVVFDEVHFGKV
jgi:dolichyl-phosphate-mannose-protein mannosyltransferase